jgi:hypothetical protein
VPEQHWDVPEWFKDEKVRHLWLYKNVTEDGATLSALVTEVSRLRDEVDDCKKRENVASLKALETDSKIDKLITVLTPITSAHDQRISTVVSGGFTNPIEWVVKNPGKTVIGLITASAAFEIIRNVFVWAVHAAQNYGKP